MSSRHSPDSRFLTASIGRTFFATAFPMMLVMTMDGLLNAIFPPKLTNMEGGR